MSGCYTWNTLERMYAFMETHIMENQSSHSILNWASKYFWQVISLTSSELWLSPFMGTEDTQGQLTLRSYKEMSVIKDCTDLFLFFTHFWWSKCVQKIKDVNMAQTIWNIKQFNKPWKYKYRNGSMFSLATETLQSFCTCIDLGVQEKKWDKCSIKLPVSTLSLLNHELESWSLR